MKDMSELIECAVEDCTETQRGPSTPYCNRHYARWLRNGHPTRKRTEGINKRAVAARAMTHKKCTMCGETKSREHYYLTQRGTLHSYCKPCFADRRRARNLEKRLNAPPKPPKEKHPCAFPECDREGVSRFGRAGTDRWCRAHWQQLYTGKELAPIQKTNRSKIDDEFRRCTACERVKTHAEFHDRTQGGKQSHCKVCQGKVNRVGTLLREGRLEEALGVAETMPERIRERYVTRVSNAIKESEFERSNERGNG